VNATPLVPDAPLGEPSVAPLQRHGFGALVDAAGAALDRAEHSERAFAEHRGGLVEMIVERASADVMLQLAATAAQRTTQAVSTLLGMQV
jgi:hypothetical protein